MEDSNRLSGANQPADPAAALPALPLSVFDLLPVDVDLFSPPAVFFVSLLPPSVAGLALPFSEPVLLLSPLKLRLPSDLKSVSYQPLPDNRNRAADTLRLSVDSPHAGQVVNGSSDILCNCSTDSPQ